MNLTDAIPKDELLFAQLTAGKLAKVMHGLMSVGTGSLGMESTKDFLKGRDKTPLGFLEILGCLGVNPGYADKIPLLRERVKELADSTSRFHRLFMELTNWRTMSSENISATVAYLGASYTQFFQLLEDFCSMLGMEANYSEQARQDVKMLQAFFQMTCR